MAYPLYLWHWPLLWLAGAQFRPWPGVLLVLAALALAWASTRFLDQPIRRWYRRWASAAGAARAPAVPAPGAFPTASRDVERSRRAVTDVWSPRISPDRRPEEHVNPGERMAVVARRWPLVLGPSSSDSASRSVSPP